MGLFKRKKPGDVICPRCAQINAADAEACDMCGASLREALVPTGSAPQQGQG